MNWEEFVDRLNEGEIIYFSYNDNTYVVGSEKKRKGIQWYLSIHFSPKKEKMNVIFDTSEDLLQNLLIDNKSLKEIWKDVTIC